MNFKLLSAGLCACILLMFSMNSCRKEGFITDSSASLVFSQDTVLFDTVFTTLGSTTKVFKVYNNFNESILISSISLPENSQYVFNIDGVDGPVVENIEVLPNDSLYVFVEVTIDPGNANLPFLIEEDIVFVTNGNTQNVHLMAYGQDAYFHGGLGGLNVIANCNEVWMNDKPHVIYGILAVDSACCLTIQAGTQVYVHAKSGIYIYKGCINIDGDLGNEVVFQGDRLELQYANIPGQWGIQLDFVVQTGFGPEIASVSRGGIWLNQSTGSVIDYAIIKNGGIGIQIDTTGVAAGYALEIKNTEIDNMSAIGLWSQGGSITGFNNLITDCAQSCAAFTIGGKYRMDHCTFGNYWNLGARTAPTFYVNNYYEDINQNLQIRTLEQAEFRNCIMYGSNASIEDFNEFVIDLENPELQNYFFYYCLLDSDIDVDNDLSHFQQIKKQVPFFVDPTIGDFHVPSNADTRMEGNAAGTLSGTNFDLDNLFRENLLYVKGCYRKNN